MEKFILDKSTGDYAINLVSLGNENAKMIANALYGKQETLFEIEVDIDDAEDLGNFLLQWAKKKRG